jgi:hypothetical protein
MNFLPALMSVKYYSEKLKRQKHLSKTHTHKRKETEKKQLCKRVSEGLEVKN